MLDWERKKRDTVRGAADRKSNLFNQPVRDTGAGLEGHLSLSGKESQRGDGARRENMSHGTGEGTSGP